MLAVRQQHGAQFINPRLDAHKVGHKRRYRALQHRRIAPDHILLQNFRLVELVDNCTPAYKYGN